MRTAQELPELETRVVDLDAFTVISDCLPLNVKVEPSDEDAYSLTIEAEKEVLDVVNPQVRNGVLTLGLTDGFETERVIKVTVKMPKGALERIMKSSTSVMVVAPGLDVRRLTINAAGVAAVRVFDARIGDLVVEGSGSAVVFADGRITTARFDISGTARVYCYGLRSEAEVFAEGIGRVFIDAQNPDVEVTGRVEGLGRVLLTQGNCDIRGSFLRSSCQDIAVNALPVFEAPYSCGLIVDGSISCSRRGGASATTYTSSRVDGTSASTFASTSGSGSATSSSSSSASSSATASATSSSSSNDGTVSSSSSSTSTGGNGDYRYESLVSSDEGDGAVAVAATRCQDENIDMFDDN